jgi:hypothetical protein
MRGITLSELTPMNEAYFLNVIELCTWTALVFPVTEHCRIAGHENPASRRGKLGTSDGQAQTDGKRSP